MFAYKSLTEPSLVSASTACRLIRPGEQNLIVARRNILQIYEIVDTVDTTETSETTETAQPDPAAQPVLHADSFLDSEVGMIRTAERSAKKLHCIAHYTLSGVVGGLQAVPNRSAPGLDFLLLHCLPAKLTVLSWNPVSHGLETVSLHYYEKALAEHHFRIPDDFRAELIVDPSGECACLCYEPDMFAFLPMMAETDNETPQTPDGLAEESENGTTVDAYEFVLKPTRSIENPEISEQPENSESSENSENAENDTNSNPASAPTSFLIPASALHSSIAHIAAAQFLYDYREPTIGILFHPKRTWTGNLPRAKDTARYLVLSLDVPHRASTAIISCAGLPYDLQAVVPLPAPVGGAILLGVNCIVHVDTSGKARGVAVNEFAVLSSEFRMADRSELNLRLENCRAVPLHDGSGSVVLITDDGILYTVKFELDGRLVRGFDLCKTFDTKAEAEAEAQAEAQAGAAGSVDMPETANGDSGKFNNTTKSLTIPGPSCWAVLGERTLFVGSELGDALLLGWRYAGEAEAGGKQAVAPTIDGPEFLPVEAAEDDDEDIYGGSAGTELAENNSDGSTGGPRGSAKFFVEDKLVCLGPIADFTFGVGERSENGIPISQSVGSNSAPQLDIVANTGVGSDTRLAIVHPCIRADLAAQFELGFPADRLFTLPQLQSGPEHHVLAGKSEPNAVGATETLHEFAVASSTSLCRSALFRIDGFQFGYVAESGLLTNAATLACGTVLGGSYGVQVTAGKIVLFEAGFRLVATVTVPTENVGGTDEVVSATIGDCFILVVCRSGRAELLRVGYNAAKARPSVRRVRLAESLRGTAWVSGSFTTEWGGKETEEAGEAGEAGEKQSEFLGTKRNADGEPKLSGEVGKDGGTSGENGGINESTKTNQTPETAKEPKPSEPILLLTAASGLVAVVPLSTPRQCTFISGLSELAPQLEVTAELPETALNATNNAPEITENGGNSTTNISAPAGPESPFREVSVVSLGDSVATSTFLIALTQRDQIYAYEAFYYKGKLRFSVVENLPFLGTVTGSEQEIPQTGSTAQLLPTRLLPLPLSSLQTIVVTGNSPHILVKHHHGPLRVFRLGSVPVADVAAFNTVTAVDHFVALNLAPYGSAGIRIGKLPRQYQLDNLRPFRCTESLNASVSHVAYHEPSDVYIVATHNREPYKAVNEDSEPLPGVIEGTKMPAETYRGSLQLICARTWQIIDTIDFAADHAVTALRCVSLQVSAKSRQRKEFVAVGTANFRTEDLAGNGSFHLYDVVEIVPDRSHPERTRKFRKIATETVKGSVSAVTEIAGRLLVAEGQKLLVRDLQEDNTMCPVAFLDVNLFVSEAKSVGNLLLVGDAMKSVWFVGFDAEPYRMLVFGKDLKPVEVASADFLLAEGRIFLLVADHRKLHVLQYDPESAVSAGGTVLVRKAEFWLGSRTQALRITERAGLPSGAASQAVGATADGSVFAVVPVAEAAYRRLNILHQQIIDKEEPKAGLNPRAFRLASYPISASHSSVGRHVLDFDLIRRFATIGAPRRRAMSRKIGRINYENVWGDLLDVEGAV